MSYAAIFIPGSGILAAYDNNAQELSNAIGLYLVVWFMFTVMLMYVFVLLPFLSLRAIFLVIAVVLILSFSPISPSVIHKNLAFSLLLTSLAITFILLAAAEFVNSARQVNFGQHSLNHPLADFLLLIIASPREEEFLAL